MYNVWFCTHYKTYPMAVVETGCAYFASAKSTVKNLTGTHERGLAKACHEPASDNRRTCEYVVGDGKEGQSQGRTVAKKQIR